MRRILFFVICIFISSNLFAQNEYFEGYDNLQWGTSLDDFLLINPSAFDTSIITGITSNINRYEKDGNSCIRLYKFHDKKLYWGRTIYIEPDEYTENAVIDKLIEIYGKFTDSNEWTEDDTEYKTYYHTINEHLEVHLNFTKIYNSYGRLASFLLMITYLDPVEQDKIFKEKLDKKKSEIEL